MISAVGASEPANVVSTVPQVLFDASLGLYGPPEALLPLSVIPERLIHGKVTEGGKTRRFLTLKLALRVEKLLKFIWQKKNPLFFSWIPFWVQPCQPATDTVRAGTFSLFYLGGGYSSAPPSSVAKQDPPSVAKPAISEQRRCVLDVFVCFILPICSIMREEKSIVGLLNSSVMRRRNQSCFEWRPAATARI